MLRHLPPRQVLRRVELDLRRRLGPYLSERAGHGAVAELAVQPPLPLFPPRRLIERHGEGWLFHQPWGSLPLPARVPWALPGADPLTGIWRTNLHYMEFLESVDDAALEALVLDWIAANPATARDAWRWGWRAYNLSIRVVVWMQQLAARRQRLPEPFIAAARASLTRQLRHLEHHLETDIRGNHLIRNLRALLWAGACFDGADAERWRRTGEALLERELDWQILPDGCHYERSPSYHCQVFGDLLEVLAVLGPGPLRDRLEATLDRMARATAALTHPDGGVALLNDSGLGMALPPALLLEAHAAAGGRPAGFVDGPFALPDAGFYGLRAGDTYLLVDCGPIGPDDLIGHAHGDILTFEWSVGGRRIIVDQGTYQYEVGDRRDRSRSTASHNTLTIDGAEQSDFFGAHRCGRRARPRLLDYRPDGAGFVLEGTHDGFASLPGQPRHVRRFVAAPDGVAIGERVEGADRHRATGGLLLHPDCRVELVAGGAVVTSGPVVVRVESTAPLVVETAEWYPDLHVTRPTQRLRYTVAAAGEQALCLLVREAPIKKQPVAE